MMDTGAGDVEERERPNRTQVHPGGGAQQARLHRPAARRRGGAEAGWIQGRGGATRPRDAAWKSPSGSSQKIGEVRGRGEAATGKEIRSSDGWEGTCEGRGSPAAVVDRWLRATVGVGTKVWKARGSRKVEPEGSRSCMIMEGTAKGGPRIDHPHFPEKGSEDGSGTVLKGGKPKAPADLRHTLGTIPTKQMYRAGLMLLDSCGGESVLARVGMRAPTINSDRSPRSLIKRPFAVGCGWSVMMSEGLGGALVATISGFAPTSLCPLMSPWLSQGGQSWTLVIGPPPLPSMRRTLGSPSGETRGKEVMARRALGMAHPTCRDLVGQLLLSHGAAGPGDSGIDPSMNSGGLACHEVIEDGPISYEPPEEDSVVS